MAELGTGFVTIIPSFKGGTKAIRAELDGLEPEYQKAGDKGGKSFGNKFTSAAGVALKRTGIAAGAAGGAAIAAGLTKGIGRLNSIEQAEAKLTGLGNSASDVSGIMEDSLSAVKGTAFGLEEAATSAAGLVAAGIKPGKELSGVLTTVGDTATIAGTNMQDMGTIFGSVAARGKLQGDDMLQLLSRGVPVLQLLAEETGKTSGEISDMVSKGEIDFDTFASAMERGMGGAAQAAGETAEGALKNVGAAAGRLGATLAGPFFNQAAGAFGGVTTVLDDMNDRVGPVMADFEAWLTKSGVPAMKAFASESVNTFKEFYQSGPIQSALGGTQRAFGSLVDAGRELAPVVATVGSSLAQAAGNIGLSGWNLFNTTLQITSSVLGAVAGPLETVANFMDDHPALVTAAVAAYTGFKTIPALMGKVALGIAGVTKTTEVVKTTSGAVDKLSAAMLPAKERATLLGGSFKEAGVQVGAFARQHPEMSKMGVAMSALGQNVPMIGRMNSAYINASSGLKTFAANQKIAGSVAAASALQSKDLFTTVDRMGSAAFRNASGHVASFAGTVSGVGGAALSGMKSAANGVMGLMGGPWGSALAVGASAVMMVADWQAKWNTHLEVSERLAGTSERAYKSMFETIAAGGSELETTTSQVDDLRGNLEEVGRSDPGGVSRFFKELQLSAESAGSGIRTDAAKTKTAQEQAWLDSADAAEKAVAALDKMGLSNEEVARKVGGSAEEYAKFRREVKASGEGGAELAAHLDKLRAANQQAADSAKRLGDDGVLAAQTIEELGQKAVITEDDVLKLNRALAGLRGDSVDATEAAGDLTEAITRAKDANWEFGQVNLKSSGSLDTSTQSGKDFYDQLTSLTDEYVRSATASGDVAGEWERTSGTLYAMGEAAGLSKADMDRLLTTMNLMPNQVQTQISVDGDAAKMELLAVGQQIADFEGSGPHSAEVTVKDAQAVQALEDAGFKLKSWNEETGVGTLLVNDSDAAAKFAWWTENGFPAIDAATPTAKANIDTEQLQYKAEYAHMQLDTLDLERPTPLADMDLSVFTSKQIRMLNDVGLLDGMKPTPDADLDISDMTERQQQAIGLLFDLSGREAVPFAKLMGLTKFKGDTDAAKRYLDSIPANKDVTITYNERRRQILEDQGKPSDFIGPVVANADGGRLPRNARGSRLPRSGPGTSRKDGILGVASDGTPMSWVDAGEWIINADSSEKYDALLNAINQDDAEAIQSAMATLPENASGGRMGAGAGAANLTMGMDLTGVLADGTAPFDPLMLSWQTMADTMSTTATDLVGPAFTGLQDGVTNTGLAFTNAITGIINPAVQQMGDHLLAVKTNLVEPVFAGVRSGLDLTGQWFTNSVQGVMNPQWSSMAGHLMNVKNGSILPTFGSVESGLSGLSSWFSQSVSNMSTAFDRLKPGTGRPAKFVVHDVFNQGIRNAWNAVADMIDAKKMNPVGLGNLGQYARGGVLPGYTPGRDIHEFSSPTGGRLMLSGGEAIMRPEWTRAVGGPKAVEEMNAAARNGKLRARVPETDEYVHKHAVGGVIRFARGGVLPGSEQLTTDIQRSMMRAVARAFPNQRITSGTRYEDVGSGFDNHMAGRAIDFAADGALARWIGKTYPHSAELFWDPGPNIKNGSPTHAIGGHSDHVHWAMSRIVDPYTGKVVSMAGPGDGGAIMVSMADMSKEAWDEEIKKIPTYKGGSGLLDKSVPDLRKSMESSAWKYVEKQAEKMDAISGAAAGLVSSAGVNGSNVQMGKQMAERAGWTGSNWNSLHQLWTKESQWNHLAQNPTSTAFGIPQFLDSTWTNYGWTKTSDPKKQIQYGISYIKQRYGDANGAWRFWQANNWYKDGGVLPTGLRTMLFDNGGVLGPDDIAVNRSGKPEPVLNNEQWTDVSGLVGEVSKLVPAIKPLAPAIQQFVDANPEVQNAIEIGNQAQAEFFEKHPDPAAEVRQGVSNDLLDFFGAGGAWFTDLSKLDVSWDTPDPDGADEDATKRRELTNADAGKQVNITIENMTAMDTDQAARDLARQARRLLAAF